MNFQSLKSLSKILALLLLAAFAAMPSLMGTHVALADSGHIYDIMFTKWIPNYPYMVGIITGGDAGIGAYSGEVLKVTESTPQIWKAEVLYQIFGTVHTFSAHLDVTKNDVTNTATLVGKVTDGWLEGSTVHGGYIILPASSCPHPEFGPCYQVTLHISSNLMPSVTTSTVKLHAQPLAGSNVLDYLPRNTTLTIIGRDANGWYLKVTVNGKTGWIAVYYVTISASDLRNLPVMN